jgi:hypothetical protein
MRALIRHVRATGCTGGELPVSRYTQHLSSAHDTVIEWERGLKPMMVSARLESGRLTMAAEPLLQRQRMQGTLFLGHGCPVSREGGLDNAPCTRVTPSS